MKIGLKADLFSNLFGSAWSALILLVCTPAYVKYLGVSAFGLFGFYLTMQSVVRVLDLGLSPTTNREMARFSAFTDRADECRNLSRALELCYWVIGIVVGLLFILAAPWIATHWLQAGMLSHVTLIHALQMMGLLIIFQFPVCFYQGALMGLGHQVLFNGIRIVTATLMYLGAAAVLWLGLRNIQSFFVWMAAMALLRVGILRIALERALPATPRPAQVRMGLLVRIWQFAAGMAGFTVFSMLLTQTDKIMLSKLLSIKYFGFYTLAATLSAGLNLINSSIFNTIFPRLSVIAAKNDRIKTVQAYRLYSQILMILMGPAAIMLIMFSTTIVRIWVGHWSIARIVGPIAAVLALGTLLNGLMIVPYAVQFAYGRTRLALFTTIFLTLLMVPGIWYMAVHYGALGAACVWPALMALNLLINVPLTHKFIIQHDNFTWLRDAGLTISPMFIAFIIAKALIAHVSLSLMELSLYYFMIYLVATIIGIASAPLLRPWLSGHCRRLFAFSST